MRQKRVTQEGDDSNLHVVSLSGTAFSFRVSLQYALGLDTPCSMDTSAIPQLLFSSLVRSAFSRSILVTSPIPSMCWDLHIQVFGGGLTGLSQRVSNVSQA